VSIFDITVLGAGTNSRVRMKLKRSQTAKFYRTEIDQLYAQIETENSKKLKAKL
jgi:hypothetical protein